MFYHTKFLTSEHAEWPFNQNLFINDVGFETQLSHLSRSQFGVQFEFQEKNMTLPPPPPATKHFRTHFLVVMPSLT